MAEQKPKALEELILEIKYNLELINRFPNTRRPYAELHELVIKSLPYLAERKESRTIISHWIHGELGQDYAVDYYKRFGVTFAAVSDVTNAAKNPVIRIYGAKSGFGMKAYISMIIELDTATNSQRLVQKNKFLESLKQ